MRTFKKILIILPLLTFSTLVTALPTKVSLRTPGNNATNVSLTQPSFNWDKVSSSGTVYYQFVISQNSGFTDFNGNDACSDLDKDKNISCSVETISTTTHNRIMGKAGFTYYWKVRAIDASGKGLFSDYRPFTTQLVLPFNGTWYVCQGYNGYYTHLGKELKALDLVNNAALVGNTGCYNPNSSISSTTGQSVLSPGDGIVSWVSLAGWDKNKKPKTGSICIAFKGLSIHFANINISTNIVNKSAVKVNDVIGTVQNLERDQNSKTLDAISHLHMQLFNSSDCSGADIAFGTVFGGNPNLTFSTDTTIKNQWAGRKPDPNDKTKKNTMPNTPLTK